MSVNLYRTAWRHIPELDCLFDHRFFRPEFSSNIILTFQKPFYVLLRKCYIWMEGGQSPITGQGHSAGATRRRPSWLSVPQTRQPAQRFDPQRVYILLQNTRYKSIHYTSFMWSIFIQWPTHGHINYHHENQTAINLKFMLLQLTNVTSQLWPNYAITTLPPFKFTTQQVK